MNTDYTDEEIEIGQGRKEIANCESNAAVPRQGLLSRFWKVLAGKPEADDERINLRGWFGIFLGYMILLAAAVLVGLQLVRGGKVEWGTTLWVVGAMMFYLSLCCSFCPLPTTWLILAVGSGKALEALSGAEWAADLDAVLGGWSKVAVVALLGGLATTMANLNEYHVFTFLLRYKNISKVRQSRLHEWAGKWFNKGAFVLLATFCFVPIPVDVVRWLAISNRYPRGRFFAANMLGRGSRYALMALFSDAMGLGLWSIVLIQVVLVLIAAKRVLPKLWAKRKKRTDEGPNAYDYQ
jgi:membrane protein YqaA with SNARE-associated domain